MTPQATPSNSSSPPAWNGPKVRDTPPHPPERKRRAARALKRADLKGVAGLVLDEVKDDPLRRHRVVLPFRRAQPAPLLGGDLLERFQEDLPAAGKATQVRLQRLAEHRSETLVRTARGKEKVRLYVLW